MSRQEIEAIVIRDAPGWSIVKNTMIIRDDDCYVVTVGDKSGSVKEIVITQEGVLRKKNN